MHIEELDEGEQVRDETCTVVASTNDVVWDAKRVIVGAGARALFYPTLLYNVIRNKFQTEFRWWDRVDEFILLGAVPFPVDVPHLKELGVCGVVTLNEPYETLVSASLYHAHNIDHLVIPTRDYLFAPSFDDIWQAVDFIHENASQGKTTYVHCKAGRGRSTTIVLCYLVAHRQMTPEAAYEHVRSVRPRVLLATAQWQAVRNFYIFRKKYIKKPENVIIKKTLCLLPESDTEEVFDDTSVVLVTESDLDGYKSDDMGFGSSGPAGRNMLTELSLACKIQVVRHKAFTRLSGLWLKTSSKKLVRSVETDELQQGLGVNIQVH